MNLLLAIAAGAASALMFASVISGAMISLLLFYLAPLPLMVAALGWGSAGAAVGALVAGIGLSIAFGLVLGGIFQFQYFIAFLVTVGIPAVWLGHLCLLAQPSQQPPSVVPGATAVLDWYPTGRLLVWLAVFASTITLIAMLTLGWDAETIDASLRQVLSRIFAARNEGVPAGDIDQVINVIVSLAPAAAAVVSMAILTLNLWLAGRIVSTSGRLRRPWPDLRNIELPRLTLVVLAVALVLSFTGGLLAIIAKIVTAAFLAAHMMIGFAVLHVVTGSISGRTIWLGMAYASVPLFWWPAALIAMLGLFEDAFGIRRRFYGRPKPPTPSP
jgi:hypothetical protein